MSENLPGDQLPDETDPVYRKLTPEELKESLEAAKATGLFSEYLNAFMVPFQDLVRRDELSKNDLAEISLLLLSQAAYVWDHGTFYEIKDHDGQ